MPLCVDSAHARRLMCAELHGIACSQVLNPAVAFTATRSAHVTHGRITCAELLAAVRSLFFYAARKCCEAGEGTHL
jgi:hypothetical protein